MTDVAICIRCVECGHDTWVIGPGFPLMVDLVSENFTCEGCGRTLETGRDDTDDERVSTEVG